MQVMRLNKKIIRKNPIPVVNNLITSTDTAMEETYYWFALARNEYISLKIFNAVVAFSSKNNISAQEIFSLTPEDFAGELNLDIALANSALFGIKNSQLQKEFTELTKKNIRFLQHNDKGYPDKIKNFYTLPPPLYCTGDISLLHQKSVGISGSRNAGKNGIVNANRLAGLAAASGISVITGHARGIDEAAHSGALTAGGNTLVILPTGILNYWKNDVLLEENGSCCVVSLFAPQKSFTKWTAVERNHLIAALSDILFIVEARIPSGSLMQGKIGLKYGKPTFVFDNGFDGNYFLIQKGGIPVTITEIPKVLNSMDYFYPAIDFCLNQYEVTQIWEPRTVSNF